MSLSTSNPTDAIDSRILDAAYRQVMTVGFRRTTLTDVAERAGLSRMTVYRRYPDVTSILQSLMSREFGAVIARAADETEDEAQPRRRIVAYVIRSLELLTSHDLMLRLLDVDPELLLPYMTQRLGRIPAAFVADLQERLEEAMNEGAVKRDDPGRIARSIQVAMRGFALSARDGTSRRRRSQMLGDFGMMLDGLLRPDVQ
jgi:AcrR family transcriptional regulator